MDDLSNFVRPFRLYVKAGQRARPKTVTENKEKNHAKIAVANYLPDDFEPSTVTDELIEEIHALNREMIAAWVRKFACGISPVSNAKRVRKQPDGTVLVTDGHTPKPKRHGRSLDTGSRRFGRGTRVGAQGAISCDAAGEVRELLFYPAPNAATEQSGRSAGTPVN